MKKTDKIIYLLLISALSIFFYSCSRKIEVPAPVVLDTVITFVSGEAYIIDVNRDKKEAEIGEKLFPDYELITMADSFLEFKIGSSGIIRMASDTNLSLSDFTEKTEKDYSSSDITLSLAAGSIVQKVKKLTGKENYTIKTASAAFGVRGTEFLVETSGGIDTLAVKSGAVIASLYPEQLEKLKAKSITGDEDYGKIYSQLEMSFPLLKGGEEVVISKSDIEKGQDFLEDINSLIDKAESGEISREEALQSINTNTALASKAITDSGINTVVLSEKNNEALKNTDSFSPEEKTPDTGLYIKTEPAGAAVYFDGNLAGYGSLKALLSAGRVIIVRAEKDGYYPFEKEITTGDITESPYIIKLEKKEGSVSLSAYPSDSEITVEGLGTFKGKFSGQFDPGSRVSVIVKRDEYETSNAVYLIDENTSLTERIILKPMLIPLSFKTGIESGYYILRTKNDNILSAGVDGGFSFFSKKGENKWNSALSYTGKPLVAVNNLFTVSGQKLEKTDLLSGMPIASIDIAESLYMNPEYYEGSLFINSGTDVYRINPEKFEKERTYTLPDSSVSNPFYYKSKLYTVTDKGVLHIYGDQEIADSSISASRGNPEGIDLAAAGNILFFAGLKGDLFAMDIDSASFLWDAAFESSGEMPEISLKNDRIILESGKNLSFYAKSGELLFEPASGIDSWTFLPSGDFAYLKGDSLFICDSTDGSIKKQGKIGSGIKDISAIDKRIYALKSDGTVLSINPDALK